MFTNKDQPEAAHHGIEEALTNVSPKCQTWSISWKYDPVNRHYKTKSNIGQTSAEFQDSGFDQRFRMTNETPSVKASLQQQKLPTELRCSQTGGTAPLQQPRLSAFAKCVIAIPNKKQETDGKECRFDRQEHLAEPCIPVDYLRKHSSFIHSTTLQWSTFVKECSCLQKTIYLWHETFSQILAKILSVN